MLRKLTKKLFRALRNESKFHLFWAGTEEAYPNFGDLIGPYLFEKITNKKPIYKKPSNFSLITTYLSVGSILHWAREDSIVWGSGIVYKEQIFQKPYNVLAVRGKFTRDQIIRQGYNCPEVYGDPGLLMPLFYLPEKHSEKYKLGVIPHYVDKSICQKLIKEQTGVKIIDVFDPLESVVDQIVQCNKIVSSSLHGIIIAHAYGVPASWLKFGDNLWGDDIKFQDYFSAILANYYPVKPYKVNIDVTIAELEKLDGQFPQPSSNTLNNLQTSLIRSCPFK